MQKSGPERTEANSSASASLSENSGEEKRTTYYEVSCHKSGVIDYLKKGQQVFVSGRLSISAVCKDGKAYQNAYVSAAFVNLCSSPRN